MIYGGEEGTSREEARARASAVWWGRRDLWGTELVGDFADPIGGALRMGTRLGSRHRARRACCACGRDDEWVAWYGSVGASFRGVRRVAGAVPSCGRPVANAPGPAAGRVRLTCGRGTTRRHWTAAESRRIGARQQQMTRSRTAAEMSNAAGRRTRHGFRGGAAAIARSYSTQPRLFFFCVPCTRFLRVCPAPAYRKKASLRTSVGRI